MFFPYMKKWTGLTQNEVEERTKYVVNANLVLTSLAFTVGVKASDAITGYKSHGA